MRWQALQWHELQSLWLWLGLRWLSMDVLKRWHARVDAQVEPQATADRTWLDGFLFDSISRPSASCEVGGKNRPHSQANRHRAQARRVAQGGARDRRQQDGQRRR